VDPCAIEKIVRAVKTKVPHNRFVSIITKLTPNITDITVPARAAIAAGTDALSMINTLRGVAINLKTQKPYFANVAAGLSGPAVKPVGLCMVWDCYAKIAECRDGRIPIMWWSICWPGRGRFKWGLPGLYIQTFSWRCSADWRST